MYGPMVLLTKASLLLLYTGIFVPQRKSKTWWTINIFLGFIFLYYVAITITKTFACRPRSKIWTPKEPGTCINNSVLLVVSGAMNLATDVFIFLLPIYKIWQLKLHLKRQIALSAMFTLALL